MHLSDSDDSPEPQIKHCEKKRSNSLVNNKPRKRLRRATELRKSSLSPSVVASTAGNKDDSSSSDSDSGLLHASNKKTRNRQQQSHEIDMLSMMQVEQTLRKSLRLRKLPPEFRRGSETPSREVTPVAERLVDLDTETTSSSSWRDSTLVLEGQNDLRESLFEQSRGVTEQWVQTQQLPNEGLGGDAADAKEGIGNADGGGSESGIETGSLGLGKRLQGFAEEVIQIERDAKCRDDEIKSLRRELATSRQKWMFVGNVLLWKIEGLRTDNTSLKETFKKVEATSGEKETLLQQIRELKEELSDARQAERDANAVMKEQLGKLRPREDLVVSLQADLERERAAALEQAEWAKSEIAIHNTKFVLLRKKAEEDIEKVKLEAAAEKERQKMLAEEFFRRMWAT